MRTHFLREHVMVNQKGLEGKPILKWKTVRADLGFRGVTEAEEYHL